MTDVRSNGHDQRDVYIVPPREPVLQDGEQLAAVVIIGLVVMLWLSGWVLSFANVSKAVEPYVGGFAPIVPLGVDIGIAAFTGLDLLMARMNMRTRWLRLVPWSLVGVTVFLNVADETDWLGRVAHAVLPLLSVVVVEAGAHVIKIKAGLQHRGQEPRERLGVALWLLAPLSTAALFRRTIITRAATNEYVDARIVAARWRDQYGRLWRRKVPKEQRVLYRHSKLKPADVVIDVPASLPEPAEAPPQKAVSAPKPKAIAQPTEDLLTAARRIVREEGKVPGRPTFRPLLKAAGHTISNDDLGALIQRLRSEQETTDAG